MASRTERLPLRRDLHRPRGRSVCRRGAPDQMPGTAGLMPEFKGHQGSGETSCSQNACCRYPRSHPACASQSNDSLIHSTGELNSLLLPIRAVYQGTGPYQERVVNRLLRVGTCIRESRTVPNTLEEVPPRGYPLGARHDLPASQAGTAVPCVLIFFASPSSTGPLVYAR